jgi:hypothetical protein
VSPPAARRGGPRATSAHGGPRDGRTGAEPRLDRVSCKGRQGGLHRGAKLGQQGEGRAEDGRAGRAAYLLHQTQLLCTTAFVPFAARVRLLQDEGSGTRHPIFGTLDLHTAQWTSGRSVRSAKRLNTAQGSHAQKCCVALGRASRMRGFEFSVLGFSHQRGVQPQAGESSRRLSGALRRHGFRARGKCGSRKTLCDFVDLYRPHRSTRFSGPQHECSTELATTSE